MSFKLRSCTWNTIMTPPSSMRAMGSSSEMSAMIQLEDPSHGHVEAFQDDGVWHEVEHWDTHVLAGLRKRARAKRIELAMQMMLLYVHGGVVKLLGGLHVELEATIVHILETYLEDDPSSKG
ncbi:hypothetical protein CDL15_Pgr029018 [Punica granatum]|uniref:Uncharacterized protein n=1 Tax=Punica granatum TaxID=22663 RepID=A0A218XK57_PUNGR|nr:hypothetical protein CDL15_Pgr029018 [Punica granatum]